MTKYPWNLWKLMVEVEDVMVPVVPDGMGVISVTYLSPDMSCSQQCTESSTITLGEV